MTESENHFVYFAILSLLIRNSSCFHLCIAIGLKLYFLCILLWGIFLILNTLNHNSMSLCIKNSSRIHVDLLLLGNSHVCLYDGE